MQIGFVIDENLRSKKCKSKVSGGLQFVRASSFSRVSKNEKKWTAKRVLLVLSHDAALWYSPGLTLVLLISGRAFFAFLGGGSLVGPPQGGVQISFSAVLVRLAEGMSAVPQAFCPAFRLDTNLSLNFNEQHFRVSHNILLQRGKQFRR